MIKGKSPITQNLADDQISNAVRELYNLINKQIDSSKFGEYSIFLNWGYVPDETPQYSKIELPKNFFNKNSARLILELIGDRDITNCEILDVSCGRGGNIYTIDKFFKVKSLTGIDLNSASIAFCKGNFGSHHIRFFEGNAETLPFGDNSFDIVINVESSGNYLNIYDFYMEVCRVLRMDGCFLYTDLFKTQLVDEYLKFLEVIGFDIEINRDITNNVLLSRDEAGSIQGKAISTYNDDKISNLIPKENQEIFEFFLAQRGSPIYELVKNGRFTYRLYRLKKVQDHRASVKSVEKYMNQGNKPKEVFRELFGNLIIEKLNR